MKVIESKKNSGLSEIGHGIKEVQFAFLNSDTGETITPFCKCKDFFNDMFYSEKTGISISIFGFRWKKGDGGKILNKNTYTIGIRLVKVQTNVAFDVEPQHLESISSLMNKFEESLGFKKSEFEICEENKNIIMKYDRKWSKIPYLNSALFYLLRLGFSYKPGEDIVEFFNKHNSFISPNDGMTWKTAVKRIKDMIDGKIDDKQTYDKYTTSSIHGSSGLIGYKDYNVE